MAPGSLSIRKPLISNHLHSNITPLPILDIPKGNMAYSGGGGDLKIAAASVTCYSEHSKLPRSLRNL